MRGAGYCEGSGLKLGGPDQGAVVLVPGGTWYSSVAKCLVGFGRWEAQGAILGPETKILVKGTPGFPSVLAPLNTRFFLSPKKQGLLDDSDPYGLLSSQISKK